MLISNPFPKTCCFAIHPKQDSHDFVHPAEINDGTKSFKSIKRRIDFFSGRRCAHLAMAEAGYPNHPILRGESREPLWPLSIVGSITHDQTIAAAIVARKNQNICGIGIDIESLDREIRGNISKQILTLGEQEQWGNEDFAINREARVIFSIKESIFKCLYPLNQIFLHFEDAAIIAMSEDRFTATIFKNPFPQKIKTPFELTGKLVFHENKILTALMVTNEDILTLSAGESPSVNF